MIQKQHKAKNLKLLLLNIAVVVSFIGAYIIGLNAEKVDVETFFPDYFQNSEDYLKIGDDIYTTNIKTSESKETAYLGLGIANGYGGPLKVLTAVNEKGEVIKTLVIEQSETRSWFNEVLDNNFLKKLTNKSYAIDFTLGNEIAGISGATYTSRAIADATKNAARNIAYNGLGFEEIDEIKPPIDFGIPEISLLLLFGMAIFSYKKKFKHKKELRWVSLIASMILLGFIFERPLNLTVINKFLVGFWPDWRLNLYWYLLVAGVFIILLIDKKNVYCSSICPFGATQECIGAMGKAKSFKGGEYANTIKWTRRTVVWFAIIMALIFRNPGISSYEVFGTMFSLTGTNLQFLLLTIVLLSSFFIKRPWCSFLCPIQVVEDYTRYVSKKTNSTWQKVKLVSAKKTKES